MSKQKAVASCSMTNLPVQLHWMAKQALEDEVLWSNLSASLSIHAFY